MADFVSDFWSFFIAGVTFVSLVFCAVILISSLENARRDVLP
mgnify:CR=1 FL=1